MSFGTALDLTLLLALFVLACAMANLLARITRLERFARQMASSAPQLPGAGQPVPPELAQLLNGHDPARLIFASPACPACDEAIALVGDWPEDARRSTHILYRDEPGLDFVAPPAVRVVPHAASAFRSLSVGSTPTFIHVEDGVIVGRSTRPPGSPVSGVRPSPADRVTGGKSA